MAGFPKIPAYGGAAAAAPPYDGYYDGPGGYHDPAQMGYQSSPRGFPATPMARQHRSR